MTARKVFILSLIALITACSGREEVVIPKDVFRKDQMVTILTDIHLVEGAKLGRRIMGDTVLVDVYFQKVFEKHNITKQEFEHSFSFYSDHPAEMDKIYDRVIENLNSIEVASPRWEDNKDSTQTLADTLATPVDSSSKPEMQTPFSKRKNR